MKRKFRMPRDAKYYERRFWNGVRIRKANQCWIWNRAVDDHGYGRTSDHLAKNKKASRKAWELKNGPIPKGMCVLHRCDNPPCCNPRHLFLGTKADNTRDMVMKGRAGGGSLPGIKNPCSKLTESQVLEIRKNFVPGYGNTAKLARKYGVSGTAIYQVVRKIKWKHI